MISFLMILFILLAIVLSFFIFIQQGKGDMGIGALGGASQTLFGGSGGQEFFTKTTWVLGGLFMAGALGISLVRTQGSQSRLHLKKAPVEVQAPQQEAPDYGDQGQKRSMGIHF